MTKSNAVSEMQVNDDAFNGTRLKIAREFRSLTQGQLAEQVVASDTLISMCEKGRKLDPAPDLIEAFGEVLGFHPSFFYSPIDTFEDIECSFRHRRSASVRLKDRIRAHGTLIGMVILALRKVLSFPPQNLPDFSVERDEDVEQAADKSRQFWGLDLDGPIHQIGRVLERAGVVIVAHVADTVKVDAFARHGSTSVIFLNMAIPSTSRWNFDIAHECGHLVMHKNIQTGCLKTEAQANRYASALMLPRRSFSREFRTSRFSWDHIFQLKQRWRVSAAAIVRRAYDLQLIDAVTYRQAYKHLSFKGWTKGEPLEPVFQEPELLSTALMALGSKVPLTISGLCDRLGFLSQTFTDVTGIEVPKTPKTKQSPAVIEFPLKSD
jgi:Zn-dependent peptidase ImmA (M78 family)/transcriptional regulator with XRE-family HTH domain